jgi:regulatory protein
VPAADADSAEAAHAAGLRLLTVRSRGRIELARDLARRGFSKDASKAAVDRLESAGWLQDAEAARSLVRTRGRRYGRRRIERELAARGFSKEASSAALGELADGRERDALAAAFRRLWKAASKETLPDRKRRVRRALLARGFAPEDISEMIRGSHEVRGSPGEVS